MRKNKNLAMLILNVAEVLNHFDAPEVFATIND